MFETNGMWCWCIYIYICSLERVLKKNSVIHSTEGTVATEAFRLGIAVTKKTCWRLFWWQCPCDEPNLIFWMKPLSAIICTLRWIKDLERKRTASDNEFHIYHRSHWFKNTKKVGAEVHISRLQLPCLVLHIHHIQSYLKIHMSSVQNPSLIPFY